MKILLVTHFNWQELIDDVVDTLNSAPFVRKILSILQITPEGIKTFHYNPDEILSEPNFWALAANKAANISGIIFCTLEGTKGSEIIEKLYEDTKKILSLPIIHLKLKVKIRDGKARVMFFIRDEGKIAFDNLL